MLKFIICEDKPNDAEKIRLAVNKAMVNYDIEYRIEIFEDLNDKLEEKIKDNSCIKVYLLDIELKTTSGIEVANIVRNYDWESYIVFITGYSNFKDDVFYFRVMAIDYIGKGPGFEKRLGDTIKTIYRNIEKNKTLDFHYGSTQYHIPYNQITYIEKEPMQTRCTIHTLDGKKYSCVIGITSIMKKLGSNFYQSHQSGIVNKDTIKVVDFSNNTITLINEEVITILSERRKKGLKDYAEHL